MKRYRWEIWSQILTEALTHTQKSKLMCQANLSYDMVQEYLRALVALGFLEEKSNPHSYMLKTHGKAENGLNNIRTYRNFWNHKAVS